MVSLQVLKIEGNPIMFPPSEVLQVQAPSPPNEGFLKDSEVNEVTVTAHIKKFLKQKQLAATVTANANANARSDTETTGDESSEGTETPRQPLKRAMSGRFPIKVPTMASNPDTADFIRSPGMSRPPPIPTRSHYRGLSQQTPAMRRPGVMPLTISGNINERLRSNSETRLHANRSDRPESRLRRMGMLQKKGSELGTLDETQVNNRFSNHFRGLSHGSAMQPNGATLAAKSPMSSPAQEPYLQRPVYVRRLSVLPERRRESKVFDPVLEAAKGILYSVFQIHPTIQGFISLASDDADKRSSLEFVLYNTNAHVEELELEIQNHDRMLDEGGYGQRENENVQRACVTLVNAYAHVCTLLVGHVDLFIDNGDPRYIRSLLTQLYNSIMELRVTCNQVTSRNGNYQRTIGRSRDVNNTIRPHSREPSVTPTAERVGTRSRNGTFSHNPSNLRVATDVMPPSAFIQGTGRTATIHSAISSTMGSAMGSATPRSGESFASSNVSSVRGVMTADFTEQDRLFERIFLSLQRSSEMIHRTIPSINAQFSGALRNATAQRAPESTLKWWRALVAECNTLMQQCSDLRSRLSLIRVKEPGIRTQTSFWSLCQAFLDSWANLIILFKDATQSIPLPLDIRSRLRPVQQSVKETSNLIFASPWADFVRQPAITPTPASYKSRSRSGTVITSPPSYELQIQSPNSSFPLPMTPQSAALGPAVQATVPSTPQSASFQGAFHGSVFDRADALMASLHAPGPGGHSRTATMTDGGSGMNGGTGRDNREREMLNHPGTVMPLPLRLQGGGR